MKKTVGVLGCGALGSTIARALIGELAEDYVLLGVTDKVPEAAQALARELGCAVYGDMPQLLAAKPDYVVEAASVEAVYSWGPAILEAGSDLIMLSVGALAECEFAHTLSQTARRAGHKVHLPSGTIGGLDVLQAMTLMEPSENMRVRVLTYKSPEALEGSPGLGGRLLSGTEEELIFSGSATEAIHNFPKNINVAVAASLASIGPERTQVEIRSVPGLAEDIHCIQAHNSVVRVTLETAIHPDAATPHSSMLAAWSVVGLMRSLAAPIQF